MSAYLEQYARDYATLGCQEIEIPGKSNTGCEDGSFNVAKVLELTLRGGKNAAGTQLGPETPPLTDCPDFEALYTAFETQIAYFTELHGWLCSRGQEIRAANHSKLVKGPFTEGVLERGIDHDAGGPTYGYGVIETAGVAAMIRTYMLGGGQMAQISTANLSDLLDAKAHPERHGDLLVRVGGYSIQFVQLSEKAQDEIISRFADEAPAT